MDNKAWSRHPRHWLFCWWRSAMRYLSDPNQQYFLVSRSSLSLQLEDSMMRNMTEEKRILREIFGKSQFLEWFVSLSTPLSCNLFWKCLALMLLFCFLLSLKWTWVVSRCTGWKKDSILLISKDNSGQKTSLLKCNISENNSMKLIKKKAC